MNGSNKTVADTGDAPPPLFLGQSEDRKSHNNHFSRMFPSLILEC